MPQRHQLNLPKLERWRGIFDMHNDHSVRHTHKGETGIAESVQALTQKTWKTVLQPEAELLASYNALHLQ